MVALTYRQPRPLTQSFCEPFEPLPDHPAMAEIGRAVSDWRSGEVTANAALGHVHEAVCRSQTLGTYAPNPGLPTLADEVRHFLHALDRGDYGDQALCHDGRESAYVTALRDALRLHAERESLRMFREDLSRTYRPTTTATDAALERMASVMSGRR